MCVRGAVRSDLLPVPQVGYGDFSPTHWESQLFTIFFIFIGVVFIFSELSEMVGSLTTPLFAGSRRWLNRKFPLKCLDLTNDGEADVIVPEKRRIYYGKALFVRQWGIRTQPSRNRQTPPPTASYRESKLTLEPRSGQAPLLLQIVLQIASAIIFSRLEPDWSLWDAFYHCIITVRARACELAPSTHRLNPSIAPRGLAETFRPTPTRIGHYRRLRRHRDHAEQDSPFLRDPLASLCCTPRRVDRRHQPSWRGAKAAAEEVFRGQGDAQP